MVMYVNLCVCRYFVLDPDVGQLQYFVSEQGRSQKARGSLPLIGASVTASDEAPHMFIVSSANGELFKLRAVDATEQQQWMTQLQACTRRHSDSSAKVSFIFKSVAEWRHLPVDRSKAPSSFLQVMNQAEGQQKSLVQSIESLPMRGSLSCLDHDLLLLKATSAATLSCLGECLTILQQSAGHDRGPPSGESNTDTLQTPVPPPDPEPAKDQGEDGMEVISPEEEVMDSDDNTEEDLGVLDDQRSVILHLLSQLKLGMDLTRVVLPTFILEKRSLLEMYANFMAHPDLFLSISAGSTPEERMMRFVEYYMTAFHEGRKGAVAKKPYNPVLGETFHCSWEVPQDRVCPLRTETNPRTNQEVTGAGSDPYRVRFVAEQVSHHPPVSGFYCECAERGMCVNTHIWTKSKFMGMSVGVSMVGEGVLYLRDHGEEYVFTFPSAYARSILTVPWVELGGKVTISCAKTGYSANVTFHTKPFYGGKVHRVSAEVKQNSSGTVVCKAQGEWNGTLEFIYSSGETKVIDTNKLPVIRKMIRPVEKQGRTESRHLWQHVTAVLKEGNVDLATEHKHVLEEDQRSDERQRAANNMPWKPKYFNKEDDEWVYRNPLWKTH
uniref:Oxysterol-binding protein n=1 Tax=Sinocyclocheilus rhinocerous TaxID=307959 RepID=A0A673LCB8_9TELE